MSDPQPGLLCKACPHEREARSFPDGDGRLSVLRTVAGKDARAPGRLQLSPLLLRRCLRWADGHQVAFVSAAFRVRTIFRRALPGSLLKQKRLAALRALLFDRLVPVNRIALRIIRAAVENLSAT